MNQPPPSPSSSPEPDRIPDELRQGYFERRRARIRAEIERNRRGEYKIPTWVLAAALIVVVAAWLWLIVTS
jgi:hypothetical protein